MWKEIVPGWIECMKHGERFDEGRVCTACVEEEYIDVVEEQAVEVVEETV